MALKTFSVQVDQDDFDSIQAAIAWRQTHGDQAEEDAIREVDTADDMEALSDQEHEWLALAIARHVQFKGSRAAWGSNGATLETDCKP